MERRNSRETNLESKIDSAKYSIQYYLRTYNKNRWENQPNYIEVFIEKKALQGVFQDVCSNNGVALGACKGYPSLTFIHEAAERYENAIYQGKNPIALYFGDYDPSGEDIPRSFGENLRRMGVDVEIKRVALMKHQVLEMGLPPAPAKKGDSRTANWDGLGQVELDAVEPNELIEMCNNAILSEFDQELYSELLSDQADEKELYTKALKEYINETKF